MRCRGGVEGPEVDVDSRGGEALGGGRGDGEDHEDDEGERRQRAGGPDRCRGLLQDRREGRQRREPARRRAEGAWRRAAWRRGRRLRRRPVALGGGREREAVLAGVGAPDGDAAQAGGGPAGVPGREE